jgi:hypothetical protein
MTPSQAGQPEELSAAINAALDELIGPATSELVEEQPPNPSRPPLDSGVEDELARLNHYAA